MGIEQARKRIGEMLAHQYVTGRMLQEVFAALAGAEFVKDQAALDAAYRQGFREGYEHREKGGALLSPPTELSLAADELERMSAVCPHCNLSIDHPADCPNNTDGPEEPLAFGVGDIVEFTTFSAPYEIGQVLQIYPPIDALFVKTQGGGKGYWLKCKEAKLLFPLSRVPKELKLPSEETIHCEPNGTVVKLVGGTFGLVIGIDNADRCPVSVLCWYPKGNPDPAKKGFLSTDYNPHEIERVVWRMEECYG